MEKSKKQTYLQIAAFVVLCACGMLYLHWLDAGCGDLGGAMTWSGKVCVQSL